MSKGFVKLRTSKRFEKSVNELIIDVTLVVNQFGRVLI